MDVFNTPLNNYQEKTNTNVNYGASGGASNYQVRGGDVLGDISFTNITIQVPLVNKTTTYDIEVAGNYLNNENKKRYFKTIEQLIVNPTSSAIPEIIPEPEPEEPIEEEKVEEPKLEEEIVEKPVEEIPEPVDNPNIIKEPKTIIDVIKNLITRYFS